MSCELSKFIQKRLFIEAITRSIIVLLQGTSLTLPINQLNVSYRLSYFRLIFLFCLHFFAATAAAAHPTRTTDRVHGSVHCTTQLDGIGIGIAPIVRRHRTGGVHSFGREKEGEGRRRRRRRWRGDDQAAHTGRTAAAATAAAGGGGSRHRAAVTLAIALAITIAVAVAR